MANQEHLEILKEGVKIWNQWRKDNADIQPDLRGANLYCTNLVGFNLLGTDLRGANLDRSNLCDTDLRGANLKGANLSNANLTGAANANLSAKQRKQINISLIERIKGLYSYQEERNIAAFERSLQSQMQTIRRELEEEIEQSQNPFSKREDQEKLGKMVSERVDRTISDDLVDKFGTELQKRTKYASIKADIIRYIDDNYGQPSSRYGEYAKSSEREANDYRQWGLWIAATGVVISIIWCLICAITSLIVTPFDWLNILMASRSSPK